jgi:hypothetical protein
MIIDYEIKSMDPFYQWCQRAGRILQHRYEMDINNYMMKYKVKEAFESGMSPREFTERLAKRELDLD